MSVRSIFCIFVVFIFFSTISHTLATCQGTQCTIDDLEMMETMTSTNIIQNLTTAVVNALRDGLKVKVAQDNQVCTSIPEADPSNFPRDCTDIVTQGHSTSGVYMVHPKVFPASSTDAENKPFHVYCDMVTDGGGWTVFQRRFNGLVDFYRNWQDYKHGFGYVTGEYWLGLEKIHRMSATANYELRVDIQDFEGNRAYAKYNQFQISDEQSSYKLLIGSYQGTAGNSLSHHNDTPFSTSDRDNDNHPALHCASHFSGCWWHNSCFDSNLNGLYRRSALVNDRSMIWQHWKNNHEALKISEMKMRRVV